MLEFKKRYEYAGVAMESSFSVIDNGTLMAVIRMIDAKAKRLFFNLDGTIGDLGNKVNNVSKMSNSDFSMFSDIQSGATDDI
jgi:hypothetical protein